MCDLYEYAAKNQLDKHVGYGVGGYYVLPTGDVLVLKQRYSHGLCAAAFDPTIAQAIDSKPIDGRRDTALDIYACNNKGWLRINEGEFGGVSLGWGKKPTPEQLKSFDFIADACGYEQEEEIFWHAGSGSLKEVRRDYVSGKHLFEEQD